MDRGDVLGATWFWKDDLHVDRRLYYTRLFAGKPGFIAMDFLPAFIATNGQVADELILCGHMPAATQEIYRIVEERGPISTRRLKKLLGPETRRAAAAALIDLERRFIITKTAITGRTLSTYSYVWDLAERWIPDAFAESDRLRARAAARRIADNLGRIGVNLDRDFAARVLGWREA